MNRTRSIPRVLSRRRKRSLGISLVEILIVVVIIVVASTGLSYGLGAVTRTKLRGACMTYSAAARFAYHRAVSQHKTVRIRLDFEQHAISLEEAHADVTITRDDEDDETEEDDAAVDPWAAAAARLEGTLGASLGRSGFQPIADGDGNILERFQPRPLDGVRIGRLMTPHESDPRESGVGYVYFFAGGRAEPAVVQFVDSSDRVYSVSLHPLTGRPSISNFAADATEYDEDDLRDPG